MRNKKYFLFLSLLLTACSAFQIDERTGDPIDPRVRAEQEVEIKKADESLTNGYFSVSKEQYIEFQRKFPNSVFYQRARFGQAQSLEAEGKWTEAAQIYRGTIEATRERQPEIAAQALYRISACYENIGDEARVLASLKDALNLKQYLSPEQVDAEIPARAAAAYSRMGLSKDAEEQLALADQGIQNIIKINRSTMNQAELKLWSSEIYYKMGLFSTENLKPENLQAALDSFKMVQIFSLRSLELGVIPWSEKAKKALMLNYEDLWKVAQNLPTPEGLDFEAANRQKTERQIYFAGQLLALTNDLRSAQVVAKEVRSPLSAQFFKGLSKFEDKIEKFLYTQGEFTKLTPEAMKRQQIKQKKIKLQDPQN